MDERPSRLRMWSRLAGCLVVLTSAALGFAWWVTNGSTQAVAIVLAAIVVGAIVAALLKAPLNT